MKVVLVLYIIITILVIFLSVLRIVPEHYRDYLGFKTKCISCENQMRQMYGNDAAWMANPSKTFSAETDGIRQARGDIGGGFLGKSMKYF